MIQTEVFNYGNTENNFEGFLAWDNKSSAKRPGVLIAHAFGGLSKFEEEKAIELAKIGYLGFAIDMYGKGKRAKTPEESRKLMNELNSDRGELLKRILLAFDQLKKHPLVDENKTGAIGFCFGGKCVLDLARSGIDLGGVASFHGVYDRPSNVIEQTIKCSVLVLHGWDDPLSPSNVVADLAKELTEKNADWSLHAYGHTGHAFTNPKAQAHDKGVFYNEKSDKRAWKSMTNFFEEIFEK